LRKATALASLAALSFLGVSASTAQAQNFAGAYAGVHAGVRWDNGSVSDPAYVSNTNKDNVPALNFSLGSASALVGGHLGYNFLPTPGVLVGVEGDFDFARNSNSGSTSAQFCPDNCFTVTTTSALNMGDQGTARLRAGVINGSTLVFATGGLAFADVSWTNTLNDGGIPFSASQDKIRTGWVIGGGFETFVGKNLIFRTEYLHEDFGSFSEPLADTSVTGTAKLKADKIRVGLSYQF